MIPTPKMPSEEETMAAARAHANHNNVAFTWGHFVAGVAWLKSRIEPETRERDALDEVNHAASRLREQRLSKPAPEAAEGELELLALEGWPDDRGAIRPVNRRLREAWKDGFRCGHRSAQSPQCAELVEALEEITGSDLHGHAVDRRDLSELKSIAREAIARHRAGV